MLNINDFIQAIQQAVLSANESLAEANMQLLDKYFIRTDTTNGLDSPDMEALNKEFDTDLEESLATLSNKSASPPDVQKSLQKVIQGMQKLQTFYKEQSKQAVGKDSPHYRAKNVVLQYPIRTENGTEMHDVVVPLITLVPITMSEVSEVKFKSELEILVDGDTLKVGFPPAKTGEAKGDLLEKRLTHASLEITLRPHQGTDGLRQLIDGYEQILRSQLPH